MNPRGCRQRLSQRRSHHAATTDKSGSTMISDEDDFTFRSAVCSSVRVSRRQVSFDTSFDGGHELDGGVAAWSVNATFFCRMIW